MSTKQQLTAFISYAHEDHHYADIFIKEFNKHAAPSRSFAWKTWTDKDIPTGSLWHKEIQHKVAGCDFAILLVSAAFLNSEYIEKEEFNTFLERARNDRFLFFPILLEACDFKAWPELAERQFFKPKGVKYGQHWVEDLSYSDLLEFDNNSQPKPNPMRPRYMMNLVKAFEQALNEHKPKSGKQDKQKETKKDKVFNVVKLSRDLEPEDIFGPGRRAEATRDFYWRRLPDDLLDENLEKGLSTLVLANPLAGKTRAVYEALKKQTDITVLVPRDRFTMDDTFQMPETATEKTVAVFDDIDHLLSLNSVEHLESLLLKLLEQKITILATCRRGNEYRMFDSMTTPQMRDNFRTVYINRMTEKQVSGFKSFFTKRRKDAGANGLDEKAFDGNIGSYFMDLTVMRSRYRDLEKLIADFPLNVPNKLPREIMKALKYFYLTENMTGRSSFSMKKIKDFCERSLLGKRPKGKGSDGRSDNKGREKKGRDHGRKNESNAWQQKLDVFATPMYKDEFKPAEWQDALTVLSDSDYDLNFIQPGEHYIRVEEVYLEKVVARGLLLDRVVGILNMVYKNEDLKRHGFILNIYAFTKLINQTRAADDAWRIFYKLKGMGVAPNVVTFTALMNKAGNFKEALGTLEKMKQFKVTPNAFTFTTLINKAGNFNDALTLLEKMKKLEIKPDEVTFNSLINKAKTFNDALTMMDKMKEQGITPNEVTFTSLINKAQTFNDALTMMDKMKEQGITPDEVTFTSLINKAQTFNDALTIMDKMKEQEITPNEVTFTSLINKAETFNDALTIMDKMKAQEIAPNQVTFTTLIKKADTFQEGLTFLDKMAELDIKPDLITFTTLVGKAAGFKEIVTVLGRMKANGIQPDKPTLIQLTKKVKQAPAEALDQILGSGSPEDVFGNYLSNRLISEACRTDASLLEKITPHLETIRGQKDNILIFYARLLEYNGKAETALTLLENVKTKNFDYYNIKANCLKKTDMDGALENYKTAMEKTNDRKQQAIACNNAAQVIYDHRAEDRYAEAADICRDALAREPYRYFPYPGHLLLRFTAHLSKPEERKKNLDVILRTYKIPISALAEIEGNDEGISDQG